MATKNVPGKFALLRSGLEQTKRAMHGLRCYIWLCFENLGPKHFKCGKNCHEIFDFVAKNDASSMCLALAFLKSIPKHKQVYKITTYIFCCVVKISHLVCSEGAADWSWLLFALGPTGRFKTSHPPTGEIENVSPYDIKSWNYPTTLSQSTWN